ncbi:zinc metalloproteinase nas-14-like [Musca autumnalis]|uniref:zinc metalloproteinase nas-14-like n=1 Tax=Musca autumnalis TaxID=221902 RepID=UPI003CEBADC9
MFRPIIFVLLANGLLSLIYCAKLPAHQISSVLDVDYDPEFAGGYLEGDIIPDFIRNGFPGRKWPQNTLKYVFCDYFTDEQKEIVRSCHREISNKTCVKFVETVKSDFGYVCITNATTGCNAQVGYQGTETQKMNLSPACFNVPLKPCHEFIHALGFVHAHSAYNRDDFVKIIEANIIEGKESAFEKKPNSKDCRVKYNTNSIMHYGPYAFSKNGKATITALNGNNEGMGQRTKITEGDFKKIRSMYCYNNCTVTTNTKAPTIFKLN